MDINSRQKTEREGSLPGVCTVIMPVYNGEQYIVDSVESVFRQTYEGIELIAIDDGSSDGSRQLLKRLQKEAPEHIDMVVLHQENRGICRTRNRGIDAAHGEYIMFVDQDDRMKEDCAERLIAELEADGGDIAIGGFELVDGQGQILEEWKLDPLLEWHKYRVTAPWGRVFRRKILEEHGIRFMDTKISEDFYFNYLYLSWCGKISVTGYVGYQWRFREESESHANMSRYAEDRNPLRMMTQLQRDMHRPNILQEDYMEYLMIKHIIWYLFYVARSTQKHQLDKIYRECFAWLKSYYPDYKRNALVHFGTPKGEQGKIRFIVAAAMLLHRCGLLRRALAVYAKR